MDYDPATTTITTTPESASLSPHTPTSPAMPVASPAGGVLTPPSILPDPVPIMAKEKFTVPHPTPLEQRYPRPPAPRPGAKTCAACHRYKTSGHSCTPLLACTEWQSCPTKYLNGIKHRRIIVVNQSPIQAAHQATQK